MNPTQRTPPNSSNIPKRNTNYIHKENKQVKYKNQIKYTLQLIICVLLGLEVAIPPNPHITSLIIAMTLYICLKHDLPTKIEDTLTKWLFNWKK